MHRGYVKIWRKTIDTDLLKNRTLWAFWCWCLLKASHQEHLVLVGYQEVLLKPGQFIFGRKISATELTMTEREVRTCIKALINQKKVTIKVTNKFSIVSIIKWDTYQQCDQQNDQQSDQQVTSKRPASDQQVTTNKNGKNGKNGEHENIKENTKEKSATEKLEDFLKTRTASLSLSLYEEKILEFFYYRKKIKAPYKTEKGINGLLSDIQGCVSAGLDLNQCLELAMAREWKAVNPKYFENKNGGKNNAAIKPTFTGNDTRQSEWECPTPSWAKDLE